MTLGTTLKKLRKKHGQTIRDVQAATKLNNVCRYENDNVMPLFDAAVKLAKHYGVSVSYLSKSIS